jgi:hypothetical protein
MNIKKIEKFTGIPFSKKRINIYLIEALSQEYGGGAEPLNNGIAIGRIKDSDLLKMVITHELIHLNLMDKITKHIPTKYMKEESQINEAITDLITYRILNLPLSNKKSKNFYIKLFQSHFQRVKRIKDLENFLEKIWKTLF